MATYELHVSSEAGYHVRTSDPRIASAAFEQAKITAFDTGDIVTLYVDRNGAGLVPERRYSGAEHKWRLDAAKFDRGVARGMAMARRDRAARSR